jgi:TfoX/Sxy family transcriptional regulator of competence genes
MMQVPRPTDADRERFQALVPDEPDVAARPMFGNVAAFVNGNMFMGLFGSTLGVKLDSAGLAEVRAAGGGHYGPPDRAMNGWVSVPDSASDDQVAAWVEAALAYVRTLPVKAAKQPRSRI